MISRRPLTVLAAGLTSLALVAGSGGAATALNPEQANRRPNQDAGHFLGHPTPTYQWHGCTKTSTRKTPTKPPIELPPIGRGSGQKKVTWTVVDKPAADSGWMVRWEVDKGWKICGVQVAVRGSHKALATDLAMMAGYTSGVSKGSTVTSGAETIKVHISAREASMGGLPAANGKKSYKIEDIYAIAVFVKKRR